MNSLACIVAVILLLGALFGTLALLKRRFNLSGEITRKIAHIVMGSACLTFPWIFNSFWPVLLLCIFSVIFMFWLRGHQNLLRGVLHAVDRRSYGELYFPCAVTLLFAIKTDTVTDYFVPIMVLTLADAVGALVGVRYGVSKFTTDEGHKSIEGALAFFITTFLSTHILLLLGTNIGRLESLLVATIVGLLVMLVEATSWHGLDNLFIPLSAYLFLNFYEHMNAATLVMRIVGLLLILTFFCLTRKLNYARDTALLAGGLTLYLIWAVAGWLWALTPLLMTVAYSLLMYTVYDKDWQIRHGITDLIAVAGPGMIWLFAFGSRNMPELLLPFSISWSTQIGMIFAASMTRIRPDTSETAIAFSGGLCGLLVALPTFIIGEHLPLLAVSCCAGFLASALASWLFWRSEWLKQGSTLTPNRVWRQFAYGLFASSLSLIPIFVS